MTAIDFGALSARRAVSWWMQGLRLWRRAFFRLAVVCLSPIVLEIALQMIPVAGMVLSKIFVSMIGFGAFAVIDAFARTGHFRWDGLLWSFKTRNLGTALKLSFIMLWMFAFSLVVAYLAYGSPALDVALWGKGAENAALMTPTFALVLILPGLLPGVLLWLAAPLAVLRGVPPLRAAMLSAWWFLSSPGALAATLAISVTLVAFSLTWTHGLLLLVMLPWMTLTGYAAYVDAAGADALATRSASDALSRP